MGIISAIAAAATWGFVYAVDQKILTKLSVIELLFINSFFTALVLLPIMLIRSFEIRQIFQTDKRSLEFIILSLFFTLLANLLIYIAIQQIGSSKAAIFEIAYPFFVIIFSIFMFQAQINAYFILGTILLFAGSAIIVMFG